MNALKDTNCSTMDLIDKLLGGEGALSVCTMCVGMCLCRRCVRAYMHECMHACVSVIKVLLPYVSLLPDLCPSHGV